MNICIVCAPRSCALLILAQDHQIPPAQSESTSSLVFVSTVTFRAGSVTADSGIALGSEMGFDFLGSGVVPSRRTRLATPLVSGADLPLHIGQQRVLFIIVAAQRTTKTCLLQLYRNHTVLPQKTVTEKHARRCLFAPLARGCGRHGRRCGSHSLGGPPSHSRPGVPRVCLALRCSHAALHKAATTRGGS